MKHQELARQVFIERFKPLGHKIGSITSHGEKITANDLDKRTEYAGYFTNDVEFEYYDCICPVCNYVGRLSIVNGVIDVFRVDDDKGIMAHKHGSLSNEFSTCPRLMIME